VYQEDKLQGAEKQLNTTLFGGQAWVFKQDSVPAQNEDDSGGPRGVQTSTHGPINCGLFWRTWLAKKRHNNLDSLKRSFEKEAAEIPLETVSVAIADWPERLKASVEAEGGHFEWYYYK
jgi:hypothetical protein